ncbi:natural cytotoxicity triggering receptor 3 ligand 1-like [Canis lupus dingo]|uniref:natural cytotoxicity triggering receptor 3 ligand 1-like n=1 Tax=Canis lupus dingo TaxID=286419 RepID=UPI0020C2BEF5|nr:natural cytotoxicity triggering receptor 3 ligand 1-like [Canis lupus dingo]
MGTSQSKTDPKTPSGCLLAGLKTLELDQDLRRRRLIRYCIVAWPQYQLDSPSQWPREGTFDYQVLTDLDSLCRCQGKWSEVPYVQAFWTLRSRPSLCSLCSTSQVLLARSPLTLLSTSPKDPDPSALSPLSEPPEILSSPPVRAPLLPPPPPYHSPVPQPPVPLVPQQNPDPTPISLTPTTPETPQLKAAAEPTPQEDPLPSPPISTRTGSHKPSPDSVCPLQRSQGQKGLSGPRTFLLPRPFPNSEASGFLLRQPRQLYQSSDT